MYTMYSAGGGRPLTAIPVTPKTVQRQPLCSGNRREVGAVRVKALEGPRYRTNCDAQFSDCKPKLPCVSVAHARLTTDKGRIKTCLDGYTLEPRREETRSSSQAGCLDVCRKKADWMCAGIKQTGTVSRRQAMTLAHAAALRDFVRLVQAGRGTKK